MLKSGDIILVKGTRSTNMRHILYVGENLGYVQCGALNENVRKELYNKKGAYYRKINDSIKSLVDKITASDYYSVTTHGMNKITHIWNEETQEFERYKIQKKV